MKKLIVITLAVVLVLTLGTGLALAEGPAEKATGTVGLGVPIAGGVPGVGWYADFNAHEEMDGRPDKGSMRIWNDEIGRELYYDVKHVLVDGDEAWFAALCTGDSLETLEGMWLFVKVYDGATPGSKGDEIGWDWIGRGIIAEEIAMDLVSGMETPGHWWNVIDGNLVVHTY